VRANLDLGQVYHVVGDYRQAVDALERNVEELQGDLLGRRFGLVGLASVLSRAWLVWCLAELGEFERALPRGAEAVQIAETRDHPYSILAAYFGAGSLHLRRGEVARAVGVLERALDLCHTWDTQLRLWFLGVAPSLGHAYALSGKVAQAIPLLEQAAEQAAARRMMFAQPLRLGWLAHAYLKAGRIADARRLAPEGLELAHRYGERGHEVWIHWILGEIAAHGDPPDAAAAERAYRASITLGERLGMQPRVAVAHLALGRLYRRAGDKAQARAHLDTAVAFLRAAQMPLWLEEAEAELAALGG
jgi:tetratricopeptide (TPR) repeat protein